MYYLMTKDEFGCNDTFGLNLKTMIDKAQKTNELYLIDLSPSTDFKGNVCYGWVENNNLLAVDSTIDKLKQTISNMDNGDIIALKIYEIGVLRPDLKFQNFINRLMELNCEKH